MSSRYSRLTLFVCVLSQAAYLPVSAINLRRTHVSESVTTVGLPDDGDIDGASVATEAVLGAAASGIAENKNVLVKESQGEVGGLRSEKTERVLYDVDDFNQPYTQCPDSRSTAWPYCDVLPYGTPVPPYEYNPYGKDHWPFYGYHYCLCNLQETCDLAKCSEREILGACNYDTPNYGPCAIWKAYKQENGDLQPACTNSDHLSQTNWCLPYDDPYTNLPFYYLSSRAFYNESKTHWLLIPGFGVRGLEDILNNSRLAEKTQTMWYDAWDTATTEGLGTASGNVILPENKLILVVNSPAYRSNHQLHMHISAIDRRFKKECLDRHALFAGNGKWGPLFYCTGYFGAWESGYPLIQPNSNVEIKAFRIPCDDDLKGYDVWEAYASVMAQKTLYHPQNLATTGFWPHDVYHTGLALLYYDETWILLAFYTGSYPSGCFDGHGKKCKPQDFYIFGDYQLTNYTSRV